MKQWGPLNCPPTVVETSPSWPLRNLLLWTEAIDPKFSHIFDPFPDLYSQKEKKKHITPHISMMFSKFRWHQVFVCLSIVFTHDRTLNKRRRNSLFKSITEVSEWAGEPLNVQDDVNPHLAFVISDKTPQLSHWAGVKVHLFVCLIVVMHRLVLQKEGLLMGSKQYWTRTLERERKSQGERGERGGE